MEVGCYSLFRLRGSVVLIGRAMLAKSGGRDENFSPCLNRLVALLFFFCKVMDTMCQSHPITHLVGHAVEWGAVS